MTEAHAAAPGMFKPQFTATMLLGENVNISFRQLLEELARIAPDAVLGDWGGPVTDPDLVPGIEMVTLNDEILSVIIVDAPANPAILQPGPFRNPLWPNAEQEAAQHKAHILVIGLKDPPDREGALVKARAVTWVTAALARLVPVVGVSWADGANLVSAAAFASIIKNNFSQPSHNAVPFWVRIKIARADDGPKGEPLMTMGTLGLHLFGLRELEYAPVPPDPMSMMGHAFGVMEYLLRSGKRLDEGETIGVESEGEMKFAISLRDNSHFGPSPVARLTLISGQ
ncbi:DUF4261 domain-containing protein [Bradyrhizobium sp. 1]|uniref:DUF4261 domain-containing protein n=1 Tax=Bradyrhizobium sp. 1 TaxID=241591 RepID=UPI001FF8F847|nr:DUF4261 domain-containing protein [Bradyrhizobium sp. 1]MCK1389579.1 DUF4261 domain-containing protein [Bradyrhizobium sp. 1]